MRQNIPASKTILYEFFRKIPKQSHLPLLPKSVTLRPVILASNSAVEPMQSAGTVARRLGVSVRTIRHWAQSGRLRGIRVGKLWRFTRQDLQRFIPPDRVRLSPRVDGPEPSASYTDLRAKAREAVQRLGELGWSQKQIAAACEVSQPQISRIRSDREWPVSHQLAVRLDELAQHGAEQTIRQIVREPTLVKIVSDLPVGDDLRDRTIESVIVGLADSQQPLPEGIRAVVVALPNATFLVKAAPSPSNEVARAIADELKEVLRVAV
jgi:excisionase family DNA binding protein